MGLPPLPGARPVKISPPWPFVSGNALPLDPGTLRRATLAAAILALGSPALYALNSSTDTGERQLNSASIASKKI